MTKIWKKKASLEGQYTTEQSCCPRLWGVALFLPESSSQKSGSLRRVPAPSQVQDALLQQWAEAEKQKAFLCRSSCLAGPGRTAALLCSVKLTSV